jgi:hypothetical protein
MVIATSAEGVLFSRKLRGGEAVEGAQADLPFEPLSDGERKLYSFEWRTWRPPRMPECRTGRGDTTLFSFMYFFYVKNLSFSDAATYTAALVDAKMQTLGAVNADVVKEIEHIFKNI